MRRPTLLLLFAGLFVSSASAQPLRSDLYSANGAVHAAVEMDGILYIGGDFFEVGIATGSGVPIDAVTGLPQSLPKADGNVLAVIPDGAGGWYIGGDFTHVGGQLRPGLARILADGSVSPWNPGGGTVRALAISGGTVYVGGSFVLLGGQSRNNIGSVDATTGVVTSWNPNTPGQVNCLAVDGGVAYVGGSFTAMTGVARANLAALDAVTGALLSWDPGTNNAVNSMAVAAGKVYIGGNFTTAAGQARNRLAALNGVNGNATAWNPNANSTVNALTAANGVIYTGGFFTNAGGVGRVGIAALDTSGTGAATSWNPGANGAVNAVAVEGGTVYAGGVFTNVGGQTRFRLAAIDAGTGITTSWNPRTSAEVRAIATKPGTAFVGGSFNSIGGQTRAHLAALDLATGALTSWNPNADNAVRALAASGGTVYVGGLFTNVGGQGRVGIAALNGTTGLATSWNPGASAAVLALALDGGTIYAGGDFGTLGGVGRSRIGAINVATGAATSWNPGATGGSVNTLLVSGGVVYAGGTFTGLGGQPRNKAGAVNAGTGLVTGWNPNPSHAFPGFAVRSLATGDGVIYLGGEFSSVSGQPRSGVAAVDAVSGAPTSWNPVVGSAMALCAIPGAALIGGANFLTAVSASTGKTLPWGPNVNGAARALVVAPGGLYVGGSFTTVGNLSAGGIAGIRPSLTSADATLIEGGLQALDIHLLPPTLDPVMAQYEAVPGTASTPEDFDAVAGDLAFDPGEAFQSVQVNIRHDLFPEFGETFTLDLTIVSPLDVTVQHDPLVTIADNDTGGFQCSDFHLSFHPSTARIHALLELDGILYVGGEFDSVATPGAPAVFRRNLAAIDLTTWTPTAWNPSPSSRVRALHGSTGTIYVGGEFSSISGATRNFAAAIDASTALTTAWDPNADGPVNAITGAGGAIYVGGSFSNIGGMLRPYLAALDPATGQATGWAPNPDDPVNVLAANGGLLYAGGVFQNIGGQNRKAIAAIDVTSGLVTTFDAQLAQGASVPSVTALEVGGSVYAGGSFTTAAGQSRNKLVALDAVTGSPTAWNPNLVASMIYNAPVLSLLLHNGMIYVGGTYNSIGGQPRDGFAALDLSTGLADPFAPTNALGAAALISLGGRIYAGNGVDPHFENRGFGGLACFIPAATVDVPDLGPGIEPTLRLSPNPARGATNLDFTLPRSGHVSIEVFDVQGRSVEQPVNREYEAGPHRVSWDGASHGAGLYFVRFSALGRTITRRAILIR